MVFVETNVDIPFMASDLKFVTQRLTIHGQAAAFWFCLNNSSRPFLPLSCFLVGTERLGTFTSVSVDSNGFEPESPGLHVGLSDIVNRRVIR